MDNAPLGALPAAVSIQVSGYIHSNRRELAGKTADKVYLTMDIISYVSIMAAGGPTLHLYIHVLDLNGDTIAGHHSCEVPENDCSHKGLPSLSAAQ